MPLWHDLARTLTGEALIDALATGLRGKKPRDDEHYRRRALAMLRQAHINPFRRCIRAAVVIGGEVMPARLTFSPSPAQVARGQQTGLKVGAGPTLGGNVQNPTHAAGAN